MTPTRGDWVRYRRHGPCPHFAKGRVVKVDGRLVTVRPETRHRQDVVMDVADVRLWKSRNAKARIRA